MKVSVIMPVRDGEAYLQEAVRSVQAQSLSEFELLIINDHSTDRSPLIARKLAKGDGRIRVLDAPEPGVCAARNLGLSEAKGEWVFFMDCDDLLPGDSLAVLFEAAEERTDMVVGAHECFGAQNCAVFPDTAWPGMTGAKKRRAAALRLIEGDSVLNIMCNKLHRRAFLEKEGIRLDPGVRIAEDALFNLECVLCGQEICYVHHVTYRYRMHAASSMNRLRGTQFDIHLPWLQAMRRLLVRRGGMEAYYGAYLDSAVLRLYKDGGLGAACREFQARVYPLCDPEGLDLQKMSAWDRWLAHLTKHGLYPRVYPVLFAGQVLARKKNEFFFLLSKAGKEKALYRREK